MGNFQANLVVQDDKLVFAPWVNRMFSKPDKVTNEIIGNTWLKDDIKEISASCLHEVKEEGVYWIIGTGCYCAHFDGVKWNHFGHCQQDKTNFKIHYDE